MFNDLLLSVRVGGFFMPIKEKTVLMDGLSMDRALTRIAHQILEKNTEDEDVCLLGIKTRGVFLAERLADNIEQITGNRPLTAALDITKFRDDLERGSEDVTSGIPELPFPVEGKTVILCDDVIYTGRSARAAMEAVIRAGRPARIQFFALIDRGHRELPIRPDYVGKNVPTSRSEIISVCLPECDGEYCVKLGERE